MNAIKLIGRGGLAAVLSLSFAVIVLPNVSAADRPAGAGEILIISDEIVGNSVSVKRPFTPGDDSAAGFGDGTNPNQGDGTANAPVGGTNNPNQAPN